MTPGRVLLVSHHADIVGGGEISLLTLVKGLLDTPWRPVVAVPEAGGVSERCRALGVPVHSIPMPSLRRPGARALRGVRDLRRVIARGGCDVVHANGTRAMLYAGGSARMRGVPAIWHLRIVEPDPRVDALLVRLASGIIATSDSVRARLAPWPEAHRRCRVIPNAVDLEEFRKYAPREVTRAALDLRGEDFVVITIGRLVDFKRNDLLLEAVARLRPRCERLRCLVVGDGPEAGALRERCSREDLSGIVTLLGQRDDIPSVLAASDALVLPSPVEGFGRVLIEAMAVGVPVIACDAAGPSEIVEHNDSGILVDPGSTGAIAAAVSRLYRDPELCRRLASAGHAAVQSTYSIAAHTRAVVSFYADLSGDRGTRG